MLRLKDVTVYLGQPPREVVSNVSLDVAAGEVLAVLGASGVGKSTLLKAIAGLLPLRAGTVHVGSTEVTKAPPSERDVGIIFQSGSFYDHWTLEQHLRFDLSSQRMAAHRVSVAEIARQVGLEHQLNSYPHQLSGGQQQRLSFARMLANGKRVVLMDEPLVHLDQASKCALWPYVRGLCKDDRCVIYVTHDLVDALTVADRIAVMVDGHISQIGTPEDLYRNPMSWSVLQQLSFLQPNQFCACMDASGKCSVLSGTHEIFSYLRLEVRENVTCVAIRCEDITLCDIDVPAASEDTLDVVGKISAKRFLSVGYLYDVQLSSTLQALQCIIPFSSRPLYQVGQTVRCRISKQQIHAF